MGYFSPLSPQALALTMGYRFETSALESLHGSQFTLSTQMITPNYTFITGSVSNTALYTTRQKSLQHDNLLVKTNTKELRKTDRYKESWRGLTLIVIE